MLPSDSEFHQCRRHGHGDRDLEDRVHNVLPAFAGLAEQRSDIVSDLLDIRLHLRLLLCDNSHAGDEIVQFPLFLFQDFDAARV